MKITSSKNIKTEKILDILDEHTLDESVEILANVFIRMGLQRIKAEIVSSINPKNIAQTILADVKASGDTLGNSLARQGLVLLSWLERDQNDRT